MHKINNNYKIKIEFKLKTPIREEMKQPKILIEVPSN